VLGDDGLAVNTTATNVGPGACPYGAGAHPYLTLGTDTIDPLILQAPGQRHMPSDAQGIPTATETVDGTPLTSSSLAPWPRRYSTPPTASYAATRMAWLACA
jgi:aldose 1-epimerase